jgi:arylsulfatase A-like enzyme
LSAPCTRCLRGSGLVLAVAVLWLATAVQWVAAATGAEREPIVLVLSWDGLRHDYPERTELPALQRMIRDGARAERLTPVLPSSTFPGHVSLATGTFPDRHGIVDNHFVDRERGEFRMSGDADWIEAEPVWIAAERQGVPAATYFWVGSESDWRGQGTRYRIAPFDGGRPEAVKVDQILAWLALPPAKRPRLVMSYWSGADRAGHRHGPDSEAVTAALVAQDRELGRLLEGLDALGIWDCTTLLLVSDHGMTRTGRYLDLAGALRRAGVRARVTGGAVAQVYLEDPAQLEAALAAARKLEPVEVHPGRELPGDYRLRHPRRTGDLVVVTRPPYSLSRPPGRNGRLAQLLGASGRSFGGHGYDPALPDMGGVFIAMGRGVEAGVALPAVHQVDVAPTIARLLGIAPPAQAEGRPVTGIGANAWAARPR